MPIQIHFTYTHSITHTAPTQPHYSHTLTPTLRALTPTLCVLTPTLRVLTPTLCASLPHSVSSLPHSVSSLPHSVSSLPHSVSSLPHSVPSFPHSPSLVHLFTHHRCVGSLPHAPTPRLALQDAPTQRATHTDTTAASTIQCPTRK